MQPHNNNILFKPFESEAITKDGIVIPDSCKQVSNKGQIVAVGKGTPERKMKLKAGMIGYRVKDWGTPIEYNGEIYYLMEDKAIIALG